MIIKKSLPNDILYLDNASTTIPYGCDIPDNIWFNASAPYDGGVEAKNILNQCEQDILEIFNTNEGNVLFTSGATESNNIVIQSIERKIQEWILEDDVKIKYNIIVSPIEHPSVLNIYKMIDKKGIIQVKYLPVDENGIVIFEKLNEIIDDNTILISCMYVNNEVGSIQPINKIGKVCDKNNILFHVDATQAVGKIVIDCKKDNIDFLTFSAHKFHGPKGVGAIVCNNDVYNVLNNYSLFYGGHQQDSIRPGTENVSDIYLMTELLKDVCNPEKIIQSQSYSSIANKLLINYLEFINSELYQINSIDMKIPILNISFKNITGEYLVQELSKQGIYVSSGSACTTGLFEPSHVLTAMKVDPDYIEGTIRISFDPFDVDDKSLCKTILTIKEIILK